MAALSPPSLEQFRWVRSKTGAAYRVIQQLGQGGNSHVYLVEAMTPPFQGLLFALKLFVRVSDETRLGRFEREVEFLKSCHHPAIMRVYDDGAIIESGHSDTKYPFVIADYLPKTLYDVMRGGLTMMEKVSFVLQLLSAASFLENHAPQVVHRDIKPENIFVRGKSCILGDFGLMKLLADAQGIEEDEKDREHVISSTGPRLPRFYRTQDLVDYCKGKSGISTKSDIFQLGLVFAEMFTGVNPLKPSQKILDDIELAPLGDVAGSQSSAIKAHLKQMLEIYPAKRPLAGELFDPWEGIFRETANLSHQLEGRVF